MTTRRAMKGVLWNFLGTYTSRYSDYKGYWLFGFLVSDLPELRFDLLAVTDTRGDTALGIAATRAIEKFAEQVDKAGLPLSQVGKASLVIARLSELVHKTINGRVCRGFMVVFQAHAVMDNGRRFSAEKTVFVAPHNAAVEFKSSGYGAP